MGIGDNWYSGISVVQTTILSSCCDIQHRVQAEVINVEFEFEWRMSLQAVVKHWTWYAVKRWLSCSSVKEDAVVGGAGGGCYKRTAEKYWVQDYFNFRQDTWVSWMDAVCWCTFLNTVYLHGVRINRKICTREKPSARAARRPRIADEQTAKSFCSQ